LYEKLQQEFLLFKQSSASKDEENQKLKSNLNEKDEKINNLFRSIFSSYCTGFCSGDVCR
jgi:hypothetical protein